VGKYTSEQMQAMMEAHHTKEHFYGREFGMRMRGLTLADRLTNEFCSRLTEDEVALGLRMLRVRHYYTQNCCWCLPTVEWLDSLARVCQGRRVLEVCAGCGVIAQLMRYRGIDWTAVDIAPRSDAVVGMWADEALDKYEHDILFASWINNGDPLDANLACFGTPMILVSEGYGGCTGSKHLWDENEILNATKTIDGFTDLPSWNNIHDSTVLVNWENY